MPRDPRNKNSRQEDQTHPPKNAAQIQYMDTLYFAFGANLNKRSMEWRCPTALPYDTFKLKGFQLIFRGVADIIQKSGSTVYGVIWHITPDDLRSLDHFEGYPHLYTHKYFRLPNGKRVLYYKMNTDDPEDVDEPGDHYFDTIEEGYRDFNLPVRALDAALDLTYDMMDTVDNHDDGDY